MKLIVVVCLILIPAFGHCDIIRLQRHGEGKEIHCYRHKVEKGGESDSTKSGCQWDKHEQPYCWITPKLIKYEGDENDQEDNGNQYDKGCSHTKKFCEKIVKEFDGCCCPTSSCNKDMKTCKADSKAITSNSNDTKPLHGSARGIVKSTDGVILAFVSSLAIVGAAASV